MKHLHSCVILRQLKCGWEEQMHVQRNTNRKLNCSHRNMTNRYICLKLLNSGIHMNGVFIATFIIY